MAIFSGIAAAVGSFISSIAAPTFGAFALNTLASLGVSAVARKLSENQAEKPKYVIKTRRDVGEEVPESFITGRYATPGTYTYGNTAAGHSPNAEQWIIVALSDLPVTALTSVWVNGVKRGLVAPASNGLMAVHGYQTTHNQPSDAGGNHLMVAFFDGTQTAAMPLLVSKFAGAPHRVWDSTAIGTGTAYAAIYHYISEEYFSQGTPNVVFEVEGIPLYDISKDSSAGGSGTHRWGDQSTWEMSENPAVFIYNVLRGISYNGEWVYGLQGVSETQMPAAHWIDQINRCSATVTGQSGDEPRYRMSAEIPLNSEPFQVIQGALDACNGRLSDAGGIYKLWVADDYTPVMSFTDDDILSTSDQSFTPFYGLSETVTGIAAKFPSPDAGWQMTAAPPLYVTEYEEAAGDRRLLADISYDFVPYAEQVQRLMKGALAESQRARRHTLTLPQSYWPLEPGDRVTWSSARNGYSTKQFRVDGVTDHPDATVTVDITEVDPTDYDFDTNVDFTAIDPPSVGDEEIDSQSVPGFSVLPGSIQDSTGTGRRPAILAQWSAVDDDVQMVRFQTRIGATGVVVSTTSCDTPSDLSDVISNGILSNTLYQVRAKFRTRPVRPLEWTAWMDVTTGDYRLIDDDFSDDLRTADAPTGLAVSSALLSDGVAQITATWNAANNAVSYEVGITRSGGNEVVFPSGGVRHEFETQPGIGFDIRVRSISGIGLPSAWTAIESITAAADTTPPSDPTGVTATAGFGVMWLTWDANSEADLSHYEIKQKLNSTTPGTGSNPDFTSAATAASISGLANSEQYWYWVRAVDTSGNKSGWSIPDDATTTGTPAANVTNASLIGLVDATSFASSISAVDIVASLPSSGNYEGRIAYLTSDTKLYRYDGSAWTAAVDGVDLVADSVTTGAIAAGAINTQQLAAGAATLEKLAVGDFTNFAAGSYGNWTNHNWTLATGATISATHQHSPGNSLRLDDTHVDNTILQTLIECAEDEQFHLSLWVRPTSAVTGMTTLSRVRVRFFDETDTYLSGESLEWNTLTLSTWTQISDTFTVPAGAVRVQLRIQSDHTAGFVYLDDIAFRRVVDGVFIADGAITAGKLSSGEVITTTAQIRDAIITDAKVSDLSAAKLTAGTALAGSITVSGEALTTIEDRAADPAARVNAHTTQIDPGKITVSGATTLADWRMGGDETKIDGGELSNNTVATNKLTVGNRGITVMGVQFEANEPVADDVSWTAGSVRHVADGGGTITRSVSAGSATYLGARLYIYFTKGSPDLSSTTDAAVASTGDNVIIASYAGGSDLTVNFGQTVIDGPHIKTGAVDATHIAADTIVAGSAIIQDAAIETLKIAGNAVTVPFGVVVVNTSSATAMCTSTLSGLGPSEEITFLVHASYIGGSTIWRLEYSTDSGSNWTTLADQFENVVTGASFTAGNGPVWVRIVTVSGGTVLGQSRRLWITCMGGKR